MKTDAVVFKRVCSWCNPAHDLPCRCPACNSLDTLPGMHHDFWLCRTCGAYFELPPDAPITHGMCDAYKRGSFSALEYFENHEATDSLVDENGPRMIRTALALALFVAAMAALVLWWWL